MRKMQSVALIVGVFFLAVAADVSAKKNVVSISTGKRFATAPIGRIANIVLTVRIEEHQDNRNLDVSCDGLDGGIYTSSEKPFWNGERQAKVHDIGFDLPPATYLCRAVLQRKLENGEMKKFTSFVEVTIY